MKKLFSVDLKENINGEGACRLFYRIKILFISFKIKTYYKHNKIILDYNGKTYNLTPKQAKKKFSINIVFNGDYNVLKIKNIINKKCLKNSNFVFNGCHSEIYFKGENFGEFNISCYNNHNKVEIGKNTRSESLFISAINNEIIIEEDCMISNNVRIWGDGHSVIDAHSKEILNVPTKPIIVGNHVWLGERVTITKNAFIPDNCICGIASVVTKEFSEKCCLIAGNPAQIKKRGINWNRLQPLEYKNLQEKQLQEK